MTDSLFDPPEVPREAAGGTALPRVPMDAPLAARMRPRTLDEVVGQAHAVGPGTPLRRLVEGDGTTSVVLHGPPGTGKTTLATLVAGLTGRRFRELSATTAGVKDVRAEVDAAKQARARTGQRTVLFVDEVHRFSKAQQDVLLPAVELGHVTLIAATTENPFFSVIAPLLSRSLLVTLEPLTDDDVATLVRRATSDERGVATEIDDDAVTQLTRLAQGDARRALTVLEAAAVPGGRTTRDDVDLASDRAAVRYDKDGDQHYDVISAFIKSIRGSDVDAALHWLARMLVAGEDPRFVARRLMVHASEDVGLADPTALLAATAAAEVVQKVGMPECRLALAQATVHLCLSPKSNAVVVAIGAAMDDVQQGRTGLVPTHLRDAHYRGAQKLGHGKGYVYPHDVPGAVAAQTYLPETLLGRRYYEPTHYGQERRAGERLAELRAALGGRTTQDEEKP